ARPVVQVPGDGRELRLVLERGTVPSVEPAGLVEVRHGDVLEAVDAGRSDVHAAEAAQPGAEDADGDVARGAVDPDVAGFPAVAVVLADLLVVEQPLPVVATG